MENALQIGVSGMLADQTWLDAIGNNIANSSTTGYKSEGVQFADSLTQVIKPATAPSGNLGGTDPSVVGTGVNVVGVDTDFTQAPLLSTGRPTDVALNGSGFLIVTDGTNLFYTRDGALGLDPNGNLVQLATGYKVVADPASTGASAATATPTSTLQLPAGQATAAQATSQVTLGGNLDSRLTPTQPYTVTSQIYDTLGAAHNLALTFTPSATAGAWNVTGTVDGGTVQIPTSQVSFNASGAIQTASVPIQISLTGSTTGTTGSATGTTGSATGTTAMSVAVNLSGLTQLADTSNAALVSQDGLAPGTRTGISFNPDGSIVATYSNGLTTPVGQLVTASFTNTQGLQAMGNNLYQATANSGAAIDGTPGSNGLGTILGGQLEGSNVNLTQNLTDMMSAQRSFQASSQIVTTQNQMLQELMAITQ